MGKWIQKVFHVYPGEGKQTAVFFLLGYLWAVALVSGIKFSDALFLIRVGPESLPYAYTFTAIGLLIAALFILRALNKYTPSKIFLVIVCCAFCFFVTALTLSFTDIREGASVFWFVLKVVSYVFFTVVLTCYWLFVDQFYTLQDAKRLFALFGAAIFIGDVTTGVIMRLGVLSLEMVLGMIATLLFLVMSLSFYIQKRITPAFDDEEEDVDFDSEMRSYKSLFSTLLSSRFSLLLISFNFFMQLMIVVTEYNYYAAFAEYFQSDAVHAADATESELTIFLGKCIAVVGVFNVIFCLFIYTRLVRRFGVNNLVIITPLILISAFIGWMFSDMLIFPLMGFFVVEGTLFTIDDNNFSLLLNAVPQKIKYKIRVMAESFFEPIAMMSSAFLLMFSMTYSKILGLALSFGWLTIALGVRSEYLNALIKNLWENSLHIGRTAKQWLHKMQPKQRRQAEHRLLAILRKGESEAKIFACQGLLAFEDHSILSKMLDLLDDASPEVKEKFLDLVDDSPFASDEAVIAHMNSWKNSEDDPKLISSILLYMAKMGLLHPEKVMADLESSDAERLTPALIALKSAWTFQSPTTAAYVRTLAAQKLDELLEGDDVERLCAGIKVLGYEPLPANVDYLIPYLKHEEIAVARAAAKSISQIIDKSSSRYAELLIFHVAESKDLPFRYHCLEAIGNIIDTTLIKPVIAASINMREKERQKIEEMIVQMGLSSVPVLLSIVKDSHVHHRPRILAGRILSQLSFHLLHANLFEIIDHEVKQAWFYYYHYHQIKTEQHEQELDLLEKALLSSYDSSVDFILQLLSVAGSIEDSELLGRSLKHPSPKIRSQAVEAIEKTCETRLFKVLKPLIMDRPVEEKLDDYDGDPLSLTEILDRMEETASQANRMMAATMKYRLGVPDWQVSLRRQIETNEELYHQFAYELLDA